MPELPEVETIVRGLNRVIKGKIIKSVSVSWPKTVSPFSADQFSRALKGKKIKSVSRRAKVLIVELSAGSFLIIHLKMTGQLIYQSAKKSVKAIIGGHPQKGGGDNLPNKFTRVVFELTGGQLFFNDLRKFGWIRLVDEKSLEKFFADYGVEPLGRDFNFRKLKEIIGRYPNRKIKQILLDQKLIAGVGNIYADESCFCAGILPTKKAGEISDRELKKFVVCLKKILKLSIAKEGTSSANYVKADGRPGGFVPYLKVYGRAGERCRRCDGIIKKIKLNGRGTHFCVQCQS